jgi:hypothetical protein
MCGPTEEAAEKGPHLAENPENSPQGLKPTLIPLHLRPD